ncbi:MAG: TonB family protein [Gemmatimonadota bacterium]
MTTANDRLRARFESIYGASLIAACLLHLLVFQLTPAFAVEDWSSDPGAEPTVIRTADPPLPTAPDPVARPALPVATDNVDATTTIEAWDFNDVPDLLPPPPQDESRALRATAFVPYDLPPRLLNPERFQEALMRAYPTSLRSAGLGGTVELVLSISETGEVLGAEVGTSSGYGLLDEAALRLASDMRFSPAQNRDQPVAVRVSIPVEFRVRR